MLAAYTLGSIRRDDLDDSELRTPRYSAVSHHCGGCRAHPSPSCACCGAPTDFIVPAGAKHSITYCRRCYRAVQAVRAQSRAERTAKSAKGTQEHQERTAAPLDIDIPPVNTAPARANKRTSTRRPRSPKQQRGVA